MAQAICSGRTRYERRAKELMSGKLNPVELNANKQAIDAMKTIIKDQMVRVQVARKNVDIARRKLNEEMVSRKSHEKLKERAFEVFKQELAAEEAKEIDGLVSYTYGKK